MDKPERILTIIADKVDGRVLVGMLYKVEDQYYVKFANTPGKLEVKDFEEGLDAIYRHLYKKNRRSNDGL